MLVDPRGEPIDLPLLLGLGVGDKYLKQEPIELGFGKGVRPFLFDRVLRREHKKWLGQGMASPAGGDLPLLHRLEQGGLGLGRGSVDFVGQNKVGKNRSRHEAKLARAV